MKEYIKLTIDVEAYYSGNTYYEEVFLPKDVWEEIKDNMQMHTYICELDGKHSEVKADIEVDEVTEDYLITYLPPHSDDGEDLFYHVYEYLDEDKYDRDYLGNIQEEVANLRQVETLTIKFKASDKEKVMQVLNGYLL